jgi:predicted  nucleic acid-binding Zn-ribbon protein
MAEDDSISLKDHFLALLLRQREEMNQRIDAVAQRIDVANDAQRNALTLALANVEKAVHKTDEAVERRFAGVNEFRQALTDQTNTFIPRSEHSVQFRAMNERADILSARMAAMDTQLATIMGKSQGVGVAGAVVYAGILAVTAVVGILISVFLRGH